MNNFPGEKKLRNRNPRFDPLGWLEIYSLITSGFPQALEIMESLENHE